jgi:hypothetical protein
MGKFIYHAEEKQADKRPHGLEQQPSEGRETGNWSLLRKPSLHPGLCFKKIPHIEKL